MKTHDEDSEDRKYHPDYILALEETQEVAQPHPKKSLKNTLRSKKTDSPPKTQSKSTSWL